MIDSNNNNLPTEPIPNQPNAVQQLFGTGNFSGRTPPNSGAGGDTPAGIPWTRYLEALKRNAWIIVVVGAIGTGASWVVKSASRPTYTAEATIWVNQSGGPVPSKELLAPDAWTPLLQSYQQVIDPVVAKLRLAVIFEDAADFELNRAFKLDSVYRAGDYELVVDEAGQRWTLYWSTGLSAPIVARSGAVGDSICQESPLPTPGVRRGCGFLWAPSPSIMRPGRVTKFRVLTPRAAAKGLVGGVRITPGDMGNNFLKLSIEDRSPQRGAQKLNEVSKQFVQTASLLKRTSLTTSRQQLAEQVEIAQRALTKAEQDLTAFQVKTITNPTADVPIATGVGVTQMGPYSTYVQLRTEYDRVHRDRITLDSLVQKAPDGIISVQSLILVPTVATANPELRRQIELLESMKADLAVKMLAYTDSMEIIKTAKAQIAMLTKQTIPAITANAISTLKAQEAGIEARIKAQGVELEQIPTRTSDEARLKRAFDAAALQYNALKLRYDEVALQEKQMSSDLFILDTAETQIVPSSNPGPRLFMLGVIASIAAGIGLAILRDLMDRRFRYPEQATMDLGLTIAGTIPKFRANRQGQLNVTTQSQIVESFRTLRLGVRHYFPASQPVVVCVTSPGPGEGKSLVSSNTAIAFANAGQKTLLIDGDVRRGVVHTTFDVKRRPGLVDYLGGQATPEDIVQPTATENLSVVASGSRNRRAPELLVSERMNALIQAMREQFEVIIIDAPPFAAGMDSFALGAAAGHVLVVLRPGVTDRKLAALKLEVLDRLPIGVIGAVVNGISGAGAYRYYYSDYADYREDIGGDEGDEDEELSGGRITEAVPPRLAKRN